MVTDNIFVDLIEITGYAIKRNDHLTESEIDKLERTALQRGYIVTPDAYNQATLRFLSTRTDYNATFYKNWEDIISKNRLELFIDQVRHYASTYGTDFKGEAWVPNKGLEVFIPMERFKIITAITEEEMYNKVLDMLRAGIAMKDTTLTAICGYIAWYTREYGIKPSTFPIDEIKNKEAQIRLCDLLDITPNNNFALLRYILYKTIGQTQVVQNDDTIRKIVNSIKFNFNTLTEEQLHSLASIFLRYKKIFLAFRKDYSGNNSNAKVINKIRRYAVKDHKPFHAGILQTMLSISDDEIRQQHNIQKINEAIKSCSKYDLIRLYQAGQERLVITDADVKQYIIRNGRVFNKECSEPTNKYSLTIITSLLYYELCNRMRVEDKRIAIVPDNLRIVAPTSEKNFVGALPYGSHIALGKNNYFGIFWREEDGTRDFDLHFHDINGQHFGWNAAYHSGSDKNRVIFSGDMTSARPSATEVFYCTNTMPDGIVRVNRYSGKPGSKYRIFFGRDDIKIADFSRGYMVDPNTVQLDQPMVSDGDMQQLVGVIVNGVFYFMQLSDGNVRVSRNHKNCDATSISDILRRKCNNFIELNTILEDAGYNVMTKSEYDKYKANLIENELEVPTNVLDLSEPTKEQIITLFK